MRLRRGTMRLVAIFILALASGSVVHAVEYHRDVAPILREYCVGCHNDDDYEGDFSVETFEALRKGGESGAPVVGGDAEGSFLMKLLRRTEKPYMPPKKEPQLSAEQVEVFQKWIAAGAKGPENDVSILSTLTVPKIEPAENVARPITAMAVSPDGTKAIARFKTVTIGEGRKWTELPGKVNALAFSRDGKRLAAASGVTGLRGEAVVWNIESGEEVRRLGTGHRDTLYDAVFSPDGRLLATAGYDRVIRIWDLDSGKFVRELAAHNGAVYDLAFSPDGSVLASASGDESVKLWKVATGDRLDTLGQPEGEVFNVAFTPDGKRVLAAGADKRIYLWKWISKNKPAINPLLVSRFAHEDEIVCLAVSSDGELLASASADGRVRTWSLPNLRSLVIHRGQSDLVTAMTFSGDQLLLARMDGSTQNIAIGKQAAGTTEVAESRAGHAPDEREKNVVEEKEPNSNPMDAMPVKLTVEVKGAIAKRGDVDYFRFAARAGEEWVVETNAARSKSPLDSKVSVLRANGDPIERVRLQAVRESWLTFRGKDSKTSGDFRVHNWRQMELNEYLYVNGEVVKLWLYPRGPDSGFNVYPGTGSRRTYFDTSAKAHPLGQPCYTVEPLPSGSQPLANGLPVFSIYYENDDESQQRWGRDSQLFFTAPEDGEYLVKVEDVRGFGGEKFNYTLTIRPRKPDFTIKVGGNLKPSPGSGQEFTVTASRLDGFEGEIRVDLSGIPEGFTATNPIVIEAGHNKAMGVVFAEADAKDPEGDAAKASKLTAIATIRGEAVKRVVGSLGEIGLGGKAKLRVELPQDEYVIAPGETISTSVRLIRDGFNDQVRFGNEDSGRNLPHGIYVDNIGLSGLLVVRGQNEREFMITAAPWVPETTRQFHLRAKAEGYQTTRPITLRVRNKGN